MYSQTYLSIQSADRVLFDQIYQAASTNDINQLQALLKKGACVDILDDKGIQTPAGRLAAEGDMQAVELLKKYGANLTGIASGFAQGSYIDAAEALRKNYSVNMHEIARGAALGGQRDYVRYLATLGVNANYAAHGAAVRRDKDYTEILRKNYKATIDSIAAGAALGGDRDYAEYLRIEHGANVIMIARDSARGGYFNYAEELRDHHRVQVDEIAQGAAMGGYLAYAEQLRTTYHAKVDSIVWGAALAGRRAYAEYLRLNHGADVDFIAQAAAQGGHQSYAEYLRKECKASVNDIARGAAIGTHHSYMEDLYQREHADLQAITEGVIKSGSCSIEIGSLYHLTFLREDHFRRALAKKLEESKGISHPITSLVPKVQAIKNNMITHHINYDQGLAWTQSDIQGIFLQFDFLLNMTRLPTELLIMVSEYLAVLNQKDALGLRGQLEFEKERQNVIGEIERFSTKRTYFFGLFGRSPEINSLSKACRNSSSKKDLIRAVQRSLDLFNSQGPNEKKDYAYYKLMIKLYEQLTHNSFDQTQQVLPKLTSGRLKIE